MYALPNLTDQNQNKANFSFQSQIAPIDWFSSLTLHYELRKPFWDIVLTTCFRWARRPSFPLPRYATHLPAGSITRLPMQSSSAYLISLGWAREKEVRKLKTAISGSQSALQIFNCNDVPLCLSKYSARLHMFSVYIDQGAYRHLRRVWKVLMPAAQVLNNYCARFKPVLFHSMRLFYYHSLEEWH